MTQLRGDVPRLMGLLRKYEPRVRDAFMAAILAARSSVNLAEVEAALSSGNLQRAVDLLTLDQALLFPLDLALVEAYVAGGQMIAQGAPARAGIFGFDGRHVRAEEWARKYVGALVREIVADQRVMLRQTIEAQIVAGRNPRAIAREITGRVDRLTQRRTGGYIGLTEHQARVAERARAELASLDPAYFQRKLRDRRFDPTVRKAIAEGKPLPTAMVDKIAGRYRDGLLRNRGETIARTESITALRAGRREGIMQAVEQGVIRSDRLKRVWDATLDKRTRPEHAAQDGQAVEGMDAPHVLRDGSRMMYPGDASLGAPAAQTIQCRCFERFDVDWLRA